MTLEFKGLLKKPIVIRHFKGNHYLLLSVGIDEKTGEKLATYMDFNDSRVWVRPYKEMFDVVSGREDNITNQTHRFEDLGTLDSICEEVAKEFMNKLGLTN